MVEKFDWQGVLIDKRNDGNTQEVLADLLGITDAMIRSLLAGRRSFTWETKRRMAVVWDLWGPLFREMMQEGIPNGDR
jgi:plasmid maintenance system antidote protein VapI